MRVLLLVLLLVSGGVKAQTCTVEFKIRNAGFTVEGTLDAGKIDFHFNPDSLASSFINAEGNPATIKTGIELRDKHLKKRDYFDVVNYPVITLKSTSFEKQGKNKFTGHFNLTIKQVTKPINMIITSQKENGATIYRGSFELNRLDYQIGEKSLILNEKVNVFLTLKF